MKTSQLLSLLLPLFCLNIVGINTQIAGLALGTALALGLGGLGAAVLGGKALGGIKAAATNAILGRGRNNGGGGGGSYRAPSYSSHGSSYRSYGGSSGSSYGSYGGSSGSSHHRGRRGLRVAPAEVDPEDIIQALAGMDESDCGKRYLCELASLPLDRLTSEEATNLAMFQDHQVGQPSVGRVLFEEAVRLGAAMHNPAICSLRYQRCQVDRPLMREVVEQLQPNTDQTNFL